MNRLVTSARLAGPIAAAVLAMLVGVTPVLGAADGRAAGVAQDARTEETAGRHACAEAWRLASAQPTVEHYQKVGFCEIDRRLETIKRLGGAVDKAAALTDEHEAALEAILEGSAAGLRALRAEIAADTTLPELREDIASIFEDFRIYALVVRQVWLVIAADVVDAAGARLEGLAAHLATLIERAETAGVDVTEARAHLAAMEAAIDEALDGVAGVADEVLPLTPADWNAGTAGPILRAAREAITSARQDLREALAEARAVIAALAG